MAWIANCTSRWFTTWPLYTARLANGAVTSVPAARLGSTSSVVFRFTTRSLSVKRKRWAPFRSPVLDQKARAVAWFSKVVAPRSPSASARRRSRTHSPGHSSLGGQVMVFAPES